MTMTNTERNRMVALFGNRPKFFDELEVVDEVLMEAGATIRDIPTDKLVWELESLIFGDDGPNPDATRAIKVNGVDLRFTRIQLEAVLTERDMVFDDRYDSALTSSEWDMISEPSDDPMDRN